MKNNLFRYIKISLFITGLVCCLAAPAMAAGNISDTDKYAWSTNAGWVSFNPAHGGGVTVYTDHLEGYAWAENIGWIRLGTHTAGGAHTYDNTSDTDWGVNNDGSGNLSGYAWSHTTGWINFDPQVGSDDYGVTIDISTGEFDGYAWSENVGWIHFKGTNYKVAANMTPPTTITGLPSGTTGSASASASIGGDGIVAYKYKLDSGAWSAETPVSTPVSLSGLSNGTHTLYVIGKFSSGIWQSQSSPTSATWTVRILPVVTTGAFGNLCATSVTCCGHVSYEGGSSVLARGVCWDTAPTPQTATDPHTNNGTALGDFTGQLTGLQPETTYYVRAYAQVKSGGLTYTIYGEQLTFTTPAETTALPGDVNDDGDVDLNDAILTLKILAGIGTGDTEITPDADADGDGKIGMAEVIYILRFVADFGG